MYTCAHFFPVKEVGIKKKDCRYGEVYERKVQPERQGRRKFAGEVPR